MGARGAGIAESHPLAGYPGNVLTASHHARSLMEESAINRASTQVFRENRAKFSLPVLHQFVGQWVAFSADGREIVGSAPTIAELASRLKAEHKAVSDVVFERVEVETDEINLGGAEFH